MRNILFVRKISTEMYILYKLLLAMWKSERKGGGSIQKFTIKLNLLIRSNG